MARFERDFRRLCCQVDSLSNGQARVSLDNIFNNDSCSAYVSHPQLFYVEISPRDGLYAHGSFLFCVWPQTEYNDGFHEQYPMRAPMVSCLTSIYHPNINNRLVCLSILDEWDGKRHTLEDLVQGLMFLFYEPNPGDALIRVPFNKELFHSNVRTSIEGGQVKLERSKVHHFETNYGYKRYSLNQQLNRSTYQSSCVPVSMTSNRSIFLVTRLWHHMLEGFKCLYSLSTNFVIYIFRFVSTFSP